MTQPRALVYEKNLHRAAELRGLLESAGYGVRAVFYPAEAEAVAKTEKFTTIIAGFDTLPLPPALEKASRIYITVPRGKPVEAGDAGRFGFEAGFIEYPFDADAVHALLKAGAAAEPPKALDDIPAILGASPSIREVKEVLLKAAQVASTALILGETGTGKELAARALHESGPRSGRPFIAVNCAAMPETLLESEFFGHEKGSFTGAVARKAGKFELAADGTIFLDEMGEISPALQAKLLRVLESGSFFRVGGEKPVAMKARIVCATNRDIFAMTAAGEFRRDLLYRINVIAVKLPPLRERAEDIPTLAAHFLKKYSDAFKKGKITSFSGDIMEKMRLYEWPGNIRQLEHAVERAVIHCDGEVVENMPLDAPVALASPLPPSLNEIAGLDYAAMKDRVMDFYERQYISALLERTGGSMQEACGLSGMDRKTLYRKVKEYGLDKKDFRRKS